MPESKPSHYTFTSTDGLWLKLKGKTPEWSNDPACHLRWPWIDAGEARARWTAWEQTLGVRLTLTLLAEGEADSGTRDGGGQGGGTGTEVPGVDGVA